MKSFEAVKEATTSSVSHLAVRPYSFLGTRLYKDHKKFEFKNRRTRAARNGAPWFFNPKPQHPALLRLGLPDFNNEGMLSCCPYESHDSLAVSFFFCLRRLLSVHKLKIKH